MLALPAVLSSRLYWLVTVSFIVTDCLFFKMMNAYLFCILDRLKGYIVYGQSVCLPICLSIILNFYQVQISCFMYMFLYSNIFK